MEKPTGVKYFQLAEGYAGDTPGENRSLRGSDIDNNFYFLRGYDVEGILKDENGNLFLKRVNGDTIALAELSNFKFDLEEKTGDLVVTLPTGEEHRIEGFATLQTGTRVATDETLEGFGTIDRPLRIAGAERTGTLAAVDEFWDLTTGETKTISGDLGFDKGYRIVTKENTSDFGLLYNWNEVQQIKQILSDASSVWRVPTKADWDSLLNYVENDIENGTYDCNHPNVHPCGDDGEHTKDELNVQLGEFAGKYLKDDKLWHSGIDKYGFSVIPVGFIPDDHSDDVVDSLGKTAVFWCDKEADGLNEMYVKRFEDELDTVGQEGFGPNNRVSLRLVKDANGSNCDHCEYIDALKCSIPTVYVNDKIWTSVNLGYSDGVIGVRPAAWDSNDEETTEVYLVNEWDGEKWTKRQLVDGDSIIVRHYVDPVDPEHVLEYHEFRIVKKNNELLFMDLVDVLQSEIQEELDYIIQTVQEAKEVARQTSEDLVTETNRAIDRENEIASDLADEVSARTETDAKLQALSEKHDEEVEALNKRCDDNAEAIIEAVTSLTETYDAEVNRLDERINDLNNKVDTEVERLDNKIDTEVERLDNKIDTEVERLDNKVDTEVERLDNKIDQEVERLDNALSDEVSARTAADADLQEQINANKVRIVKNEHPSDTSLLYEYTLVYVESGEPVEGANTVKVEIPKDRFFKTAFLCDADTEIDESTGEIIGAQPEKGDYLGIVFCRDDGKFLLTKVPLGKFLEESEFKDGLEVVNHVVYVKIADGVGDEFIHVDGRGIFTTGIRDAIDDAKDDALNALSSARTEILGVVNSKEAALQEQINTLTGLVQTLTSRVAQLETSLQNLLTSNDFKAAVADKVVDMLDGTDHEISVTQNGNRLKIGFADGAWFAADNV